MAGSAENDWGYVHDKVLWSFCLHIILIWIALISNLSTSFDNLASFPIPILFFIVQYNSNHDDDDDDALMKIQCVCDDGIVEVLGSLRLFWGCRIVELFKSTLKKIILNIKAFKTENFNKIMSIFRLWHFCLTFKLCFLIEFVNKILIFSYATSK